MKRSATILLLIILSSATIASKIIAPVHGTPLGSPTALPGTDPATNIFPKLLQATNGSIWLTWEKVVGTYGQVYLMVNNGFGWSGQIPLVNSGGTYDDITPTLAQLTNGTIILAWSRGSTGSGACSSQRTYDIYTQRYTNGVWSSPVPLVQAAGDDLTPAMARLKDGRVMLVWTRCTIANAGGDIYYKILNNTWGPESLLVGSTSDEEKLPSILQANDGRVWVFYSSNTGTGASNVLDDVIWNGLTWTSPALVTNAGVDDDWSSIAQDRNQTLWLFWSRNVYNGTVSGVPTYQYDLFYKNSTNNGVSWSPEQTLAPNISSQEKQPTIVQTSSKKLWIVYASDQQLGNPYHTDNLYLITSDVVKVHDLNAVSAALPPVLPFHRVGETMNISVTVTNLGDYTESSTVKCYANNTLVYSKPITITAAQTSTWILPWNSTGSLAGNYLVKATVNTVAGEFLTTNNSVNASAPFPLTFRGDVSRDGKVDIVDLATVASHFGAVKTKPNYYPDADLNHDGVTDIVDLTLVGGEFGKSTMLHDLAILSATLPTITPRSGEIVRISTVVANLGVFDESSQVTLSINSVVKSSIPITIASARTTTVTFDWNSTGQQPGTLSVTVRVNPVTSELQTTNNSINSTLVLTFRGDVNRDRRVDISDLSLIAGHFGSVLGSPAYYSEADLNRDGVIDIQDMSICASDFGKTLT